MFQEKKVNVNHIESRRSRKRPGEFDILVDLVGEEESLSESASAIKPYVSAVQLHGMGKRSPLEKLGRDSKKKLFLSSNSWWRLQSFEGVPKSQMLHTIANFFKIVPVEYISIEIKKAWYFMEL